MTKKNQPATPKPQRKDYDSNSEYELALSWWEKEYGKSAKFMEEELEDLQDDERTPDEYYNRPDEDFPSF